MAKGFLEKALTANGRRILLDGLAINNAQLLLDSSNRIIGANENINRVIGYSPVGKLFFEVFTPSGDDGARATRALISEVEQNDFAIRLGRMKHSDGTVRQVTIRYYGAHNSKEKVQAVVMCSDMTDSFEAESSREAQVAAVNRSFAVIEFTPDGTILNYNDVFCRAMGYGPGALKGKKHRLFVPEHVKSEAEYQAFWRDLANNKVKSGEFERARKDGTPIWLEASYTPVLDINGRVYKVVKVATDITEKVQLRIQGSQIANQVDHKLGEIVSAVSNANERSASATSAASQTSQMVRQVADAIQDFETTTRRISDAMAKSRNAASHMNDQAQTADKHISELSEAASSMTSIVEIIQKVAGQINLLALNATIEAARAGEAGKGFAVVAAEVKSLADQVEKSTNQIGADIDRVQNVAGDVVSVLKGMSATIHEVEDSVGVAADAVEEQTSAAQEISAGMNQAASSVHHITDNLTEISAAVASANGFAKDGSELYRSVKASAAVH